MPRARRTRPSCSAGQASVELVAAMPLIVLVCLALWQGVVAGQAVWLSGNAARAAARAAAIGTDTTAAARRAVPRALRDGLRVDDAGGTVTVHVPVPLVVGGGSLATITTRASLPTQR